MQPSQFPLGGFPEGDARHPGSDQTYPVGTVVTWDTSSHELDAHAGGATVTNVLGVSAEGVVAGIAQNPDGLVNFFYGGRGNYFSAKLTDNAGVEQTVGVANINVRYGFVRTGTGLNSVDTVDNSDTTDVVLEVTGIDVDRNIVFFKFIDSALENE